MKIVIEENTEYDTDVHPEVTKICFKRRIVGNFFKDDRFPNLVHLACSGNRLTKLNLNCPSLRTLWCYENQLTTLELNCPSLRTLCCEYNKLTTLKLNCPSLQKLLCSNNQLTTLELNCPSLQKLWCYNIQLTNLNGLEFCENLSYLECSKRLSASVNILKTHLPNLVVKYEYEYESE
jgi:Leucine-rich repeat (LRR) protein